MDHFAYQLSEVSLTASSGRREVEALLGRHGLRMDASLRRYYGVYRDGRLVGGAGYSGNVVKCVAVDAEHQSEGLADALVSRIMTDMFQTGVANVFLFTKPENEARFSHLQFSKIEATGQVLLMESDRRAFPRYLRELSGQKSPGKTGAVVMNCNPFTLGHQYLAERASARCDRLLLFAVQEDASIFPFPVRLRLIREGVAHLPNVTVLPGGPYIISAATFPTYFLPEGDEAVSAHTRLDTRVFGRHICPAAGISERFAGEEPYSRVTALYNEALLRDLPGYGVKVTVFPRKEQGREAISASRVRRLIGEGLSDQVRGLVPDSTWAFLCCEEARPIIQKLRQAAE